MQQSTIDKHKHLLTVAPDATSAQCWEAAGKFTNACCWDEHQTYHLVAKDGPDACYHPIGRGVVCDKVCNLHSGDVYDMVTNGGLPSQSAGFNKVEGQRIDPGQMVPPYDPLIGSTAPPTNAEGFPPYPGDQHFDVIGQALFDDYAEANKAPNPGMSRWYGRCDYDFLTGNVASNVDAVNKHRPDWRRELGLPPKASSVG